MPGLSPITEFALAARVHDDALDLETLAVGIARIGNPGVDRAAVHATLDEMAARVAEAVDLRAAPDRLATGFARALVVDLGFHGEPEAGQTPEGSYLDRVLERRTGLPILLGVVWILVADRLGVPIRGVSYPGHFLVCLDAPGARIYLDPFHHGAVRDAGELLARLGPRAADRKVLEPAGVRAIVARMLANLKNLWVDRGDHAHALAAVDRLLLVQGETPGELRDRGLLCLHLERPDEAERDFRRYLKLNPEAEDRPVIAALLDRIESNRREDG